MILWRRMFIFRPFYFTMTNLNCWSFQGRISIQENCFGDSIQKFTGFLIHSGSNVYIHSPKKPKVLESNLIRTRLHFWWGLIDCGWYLFFGSIKNVFRTIIKNKSQSRLVKILGKVRTAHWKDQSVLQKYKSYPAYWLI